MRKLLMMMAPACLLIAAAPPTQAGSLGSYPVRTFSSGSNSELTKTIPISRKRGAKPKVVMRLDADRLGRLDAGDRLVAGAEVEVTTCLDAPAGYRAACVGKTYPYDPHVAAKVVLTDDRHSTRGKVIGAHRDLECSQHLPNRNHHCVLVLPWKGSVLERDCTTCNLNLVMTSWHSGAARKGDQLVIGTHDSYSPIEQDKGRLSLVRFRPGDTPGVDPVAGTRRNVRLPVANEGSKPTDVINRTVHLTNLHAGDEIQVEALTKTGIGSVPYNVLLKSKVYAARSRGALNGGGTDRYTAPNPEISELNGFNCTHGPSAHRNPCTRPKLGVVRISSDVNELYIHLQLNAQAKPNESNQNSWHSGDRVKVRDSYLRVWLYRAA